MATKPRDDDAKEEKEEGTGFPQPTPANPPPPPPQQPPKEKPEQQERR